MRSSFLYWRVWAPMLAAILLMGADIDCLDEDDEEELTQVAPIQTSFDYGPSRIITNTWLPSVSLFVPEREVAFSYDSAKRVSSAVVSLMDTHGYQNHRQLDVTYNDLGLLGAVTQAAWENGGWVDTKRFEWDYDDEGNLLKWRIMGPSAGSWIDQRRLVNHWSNGKVVAQSYQTASGSNWTVTATFDLTYDDQARLADVIKRENGTMLSLVYTYEWDNYGPLSTDSWMDLSGGAAQVPYGHMAYTTDNSGRISVAIQTNSISGDRRYTYNFDTNDYLRNILIEEDDGTGTWVPKIRHDLQHTTDGSSQSWQLGFTEDPDVLESTDLIRHWPGLPISHYRTLWGYAPLKE